MVPAHITRPGTFGVLIVGLLECLEPLGGSLNCPIHRISSEGWKWIRQDSLRRGGLAMVRLMVGATPTPGIVWVMVSYVWERGLGICFRLYPFVVELPLVVECIIWIRLKHILGFMSLTAVYSPTKMCEYWSEDVPCHTLFIRPVPPSGYAQSLVTLMPHSAPLDRRCCNKVWLKIWAMW